MEEMSLFNKSIIHLYHGSKSGIKGKIKPESRTTCDFGKGFYMGDLDTQPKGLIADKKYSEARFYEIDLETRDLNIKRFDNPVEWVLFITYNRKNFVFPDKIQEYFQSLSKSYDLMIGLIADDSMSYVLEDFYRGNITHKALIESLQYVQLGYQYVAKTQKACAACEIMKDYKLSDKELRLIGIENSALREKIPLEINQIKRKYRREGMYFDELLEAYKDGKF